MLFQISTPEVASAESRVALVIGQSAYRAVPALPNAANDGKQMVDLLGSAGFDVTAAVDLAQNDMRQTISDFAAKVAASGPDTVALVYYAGHGLQIDGENYLVPVDVDPKREADIPLQAVRLNDLMNTLGELPTRMRIFMLDLAGGGGGGRQRRRQPLHDGAALGRQGAESADRGSFQARPCLGEPGDRGPADPVGKFIADERLQVLSRRQGFGRRRQGAESRLRACHRGRHGRRLSGIYRAVRPVVL